MAFGIDDIVGTAVGGLGSLFGGLFGGDSGSSNAPTPHHRNYTDQLEDLQFLSGMGRLARSGSPYPAEMLASTGEQGQSLRDSMGRMLGNPGDQLGSVEGTRAAYQTGMLNRGSSGPSGYYSKKG